MNSHLINSLVLFVVLKHQLRTKMNPNDRKEAKSIFPKCRYHVLELSVLAVRWRSLAESHPERLTHARHCIVDIRRPRIGINSDEDRLHDESCSLEFAVSEFWGILSVRDTHCVSWVNFGVPDLMPVHPYELGLLK